MSRQANQNGYSMLEMLVVVAIVVILVSAAVPSLNSARALYRLATSRDELVGVIESTRTEAIKRDSESTITIVEECLRLCLGAVVPVDCYGGSSH